MTETAGKKLGKNIHKKRTCDWEILDFQLLLARKVKLMRNTASFLMPLVCQSLHPMKYTPYRHSDKILMFTFIKFCP